MGMLEMSAWSTISGGLTTLVVSVLLIATKHLHGKLSMDTSVGVHKFHTQPTPRIGGVAIMAGLLVSWALAKLLVDISMPLAQESARLLGLMLLAAVPAVTFGILEDITKRVGVRARLLATMGSGLLAWWLTDTAIGHVGIWGVDNLLAILPISVAFTAFAVGGVANSFNIIDGFNGLAAGALLISLTSIGCIAYGVGDPALALLCLTVAAVVLGFGVVNFPFGKIFLGDGGAYLLGFMVAWIAVLLPARNPSVSAWAALLACGYPVLEVLFSIWRKYRRTGSHPGQPDKVHLHMLFYKRISKHTFRHAQPALQNGLSSIFAWAYALVPATIAICWPQNTWIQMAGFLVSGILYRLIYVRLTQFKWNVPIKLISKMTRYNMTRNVAHNVTRKMNLRQDDHDPERDVA